MNNLWQLIIHYCVFGWEEEISRYFCYFLHIQEAVSACNSMKIFANENGWGMSAVDGICNLAAPPLLQSREILQSFERDASIHRSVGAGTGTVRPQRSPDWYRPVVIKIIVPAGRRVSGNKITGAPFVWWRWWSTRGLMVFRVGCKPSIARDCRDS